MRTFPTGWSSTSGVFPTRSRTDRATVLRIPPPDIGRRAQLAEELVDAPTLPGRIRGDASRSVALEEVRLAAVQPGKLEQVAARVPGSVFDHALPPLTGEP